jgi:hypothetical protein
MVIGFLHFGQAGGCDAGIEMAQGNEPTLHLPLRQHNGWQIKALRGEEPAAIRR